ncbi:MAG: hypothetical protein WA913_14995 [Pricia sp.]
MLNLDYDSQKFLYKIQKWGSLNPDVELLLCTDHQDEINENPLFNYTIIAVVNDCLDFTRDLFWINFFGRSEKHALSESEEKHTIEISYQEGPDIKFILFESHLASWRPFPKHSRVLVDKKA